MGGSSKSSSTSTTENTTSTATSTGVVGDVLQGQNITVNDYLSEDVADVFKQLTAIVGQSLDIVSGAGELIKETNDSALTQTQEFAKQAIQPDLTVLSQGQKTLIYAIFAFGAVAGIYFLTKGRK